MGFIRANEAKSTGTATEIYDPIADRTVDVLSMGEKYFFWIMRYRDDVKEIREQMVLNPDTVRKICEANEFRVPIKCLTTDFLVTYKDGSSVAYSVKSDRKVLDKDTYRNPGSYEELLIRQYIEKCYWEQHGVDFRIVFSNELNTVMAQNVAACMLFYDRKYVTDTETKLKYLIAHKKIQIPMEQEILNFAGLAEAARDKLEELYTKGG
ncbi:TnsA endonuclease N-terminal domain-containing protein [uncultured Clostridium sp.]|uniref:TnsA endonuclease N-terminal domain-containing protein n=1 Tax=uncultured Clostridium sp. TaxID=59620 RepID=UPI002592DF92|nr:TnsA endonuclease N-terminal domain-containing protein [uncultured Clostridium sp.]